MIDFVGRLRRRLTWCLKQFPYVKARIRCVDHTIELDIWFTYIPNPTVEIKLYAEDTEEMRYEPLSRAEITTIVQIIHTLEDSFPEIDLDFKGNNHGKWTYSIVVSHLGIITALTDTLSHCLGQYPDARGCFNFRHGVKLLLWFQYTPGSTPGKPVPDPADRRKKRCPTLKKSQHRTLKAILGRMSEVSSHLKITFVKEEKGLRIYKFVRIDST